MMKSDSENGDDKSKIRENEWIRWIKEGLSIFGEMGTNPSE